MTAPELPRLPLEPRADWEAAISSAAEVMLEHVAGLLIHGVDCFEDSAIATTVVANPRFQADRFMEVTVNRDRDAADPMTAKLDPFHRPLFDRWLQFERFVADRIREPLRDALRDGLALHGVVVDENDHPPKAILHELREFWSKVNNGHRPRRHPPVPVALHAFMCQTCAAVVTPRGDE